MKTPTLVILAAGMGSRYGGLKQMDTLGSQGESIIDFSIYDAIQAGFKRLILIIKKEHEEAFEKQLVSQIRPFIQVDYAYQELLDVPNDIIVSQERVKPWGTTHALLSIEPVINGDPFMVINADDFYGRSSFVMMHHFLSNEVQDSHYGMIGYGLKNTLTEHGSVTRALCDLDENQNLKKIVEIQKIEKHNDTVVIEEEGVYKVVDSKQLVSMNYWGFTPKILEEIRPLFDEFIRREILVNPLKCEHVIPTAIGQLLEKQQITVKVMSSTDQWYGVTYQEDKPHVISALQEQKEKGIYPEYLWRKDS